MCSCVLIKLYVTCRQVESLHFNFWVVFFHSSFQFTNCNIRNHATLKQCSIIELLILHICTEIILSFFQICVSDLGSSNFSLKLVHPEVTVLSIAYCKSNGSNPDLPDLFENQSPLIKKKAKRGLSLRERVTGPEVPHYFTGNWVLITL